MLDQSMIDAFGRALRGPLIRPDDAGYDQARAVWNGMIDRWPALIAKCMCTQDVVGAVRFASRQRLPVAIRGGGHSVAGTSVRDDAMTIDLSAMKAVEVDPDRRTARVSPGARWADFDREAQAFGLATTGGVNSRTGVAGLTLGGGLGYLARRCGLTADNLLAAEVVTGDGEVIPASKTEHPDLFWALRGGGGGLGVVTSFEFRLHPVGPDVYTVQAFYRMADAADALGFYRELTADAPDELACYALAIHLPPVDLFPDDLHGTTALALVACYAGEVDKGRARLADLEGFGDPVARVATPMPYTALQQSVDDAAPDAARYYWKSHYLDELSDEAIETFVRHAESMPGPLSIAGLEPMGGAIARVKPTATAFPHRSAGFSLGLWSGWVDPRDDDRIVAATRDFHAAMAPHATGGMYANYLDRDDADRVRAAYGPNWDRIRELRARYGV